MQGLAAVSTAEEADSRRSQMQEDLASAIVVLGRRWRARLTELLRDSEQTDARWNVLHTLARSPSGVIQAELADAVGVQGPTLVKLLDALEAQGLIRRQVQPRDRRAKAIYLEPKGAEILDCIDRIAADFRDHVFQGVSDADLVVALSVLERAGRRLAASTHPDTPPRSSVSAGA